MSAAAATQPASAAPAQAGPSYIAQDLLNHIARMPALQYAIGSESLCTTLNAPVNRNGWRYTTAGPDPGHLPRVLFREVPMAPFGVHWDWIDRSSYTKISRDATIISTDRGWRSARANVGVRWGAWYYEVEYLEPEGLAAPSHSSTSTSAIASAAAAALGSLAGSHLSRGASPSIPGNIAAQSMGLSSAFPASGSSTPRSGSHLAHNTNNTSAYIAPAPLGSAPAPMKDGPHLRLGWGRREASLNAPAGFDGYSYAIRDSTGQKCHLSRMSPYAEQGFLPGDTIGIYVYIPPPAYIRAKKPRTAAAAAPNSNVVATAAPGAPASRQDLPKLPPRERHVRRKRLPIRYKGQLYFEAFEYTASKEMEHLMERSRRGLQKTLPTDEGQPDIIGIDCPYSDDPAVMAAFEKTQAEKKAAAAAAQQKKRRMPGQPMANPTANLNLRPLPVLKGSFVGFSINGRWQGIAFKDLLDFRPLPAKKRRGGTTNAPNHKTYSSSTGQGSVSKEHNSKKAKERVAREGKRAGSAGRNSSRSTPIPGYDSGASTDSSDTTSDSSMYSSDSSSSSRGGGGAPNGKGKGKASGGGHHSSHRHHRRSESPEPGRSTRDRILELRLNLYDDGETGYFPFVSLFGGARARLNAGPHFKYDMQADEMRDDAGIRAALAEAEPASSSASFPGKNGEGGSDHSSHHSPSSPSTANGNKINWRPLSDRYEDYFAELLAYDLADERRLARRLHRRHGRRRRGEFDPYDLLRHSGDGSGARGASAIAAGGIAGALGEQGGLGDAGEGGLGGVGNGANSSLLGETQGRGTDFAGGAGGDAASASGPTGTKVKSNPNRSKAGRRESGKGHRPLPLLRKKKKKSKAEKAAAAQKALETKRRRREEEEAAALLAADGDGDNADGEEGPDEEEEAADEDDDEEEDAHDNDDSGHAEPSGSDAKRPRLSPGAMPPGSSAPDE
ncbi:hypothetical protein V8E36_003150 [Tilletia maclaganii]